MADNLPLVPDAVLDDLCKAVDAVASTFDGRGSAIRELSLRWPLKRRCGRSGENHGASCALVCRHHFLPLQAKADRTARERTNPYALKVVEPIKFISDEQLPALLAALAEAARADRYTAERFVPPRIGILEETAARRHQFVLGRRGVGKSTLLRKIESIGDEVENVVVFVDIETLRDRPYPDVLIELLIELLDGLRDRLKPDVWYRFDQRIARLQVRRRLADLTATLRRLLAQPQVAQRTVRELQSRASNASVKSGLRLRHRDQGIDATAEAQRAQESEESSEGTEELTKMDGLLSAAVLIRDVLNAAKDALGNKPTLIVLDDFYHVPFTDQPDVLAYLHQVVKNLNIWLKICGVRHRLHPFVEGDPPRGMQVGQDAAEISLDITLERFQAAQAFLEQVLSGICEPLSIPIDALLTDGGRQRLVLGSGGVARDYLYLTQNALRNANERVPNPSRPHNRIGAEDVNEAAAGLSAQKQEDLARDAGPNADAVRARLSDVANFCLDFNGTNIFLVEGTNLQEQDWGKEIQALADLRLVHQIGNLSVQTGSYRGRRFVGFTLDLSNWTGTRSEKIRQIEFWTPDGRQEARRARLIYTPGVTDRPVPPPALASSEPGPDDEELPGDWVQTDIFTLLDQPTAATDQPVETVEQHQG